MTTDDPRAELTAWLVDVLRRRGKHEDKAREILDALCPEGEVITTVAVRNTHMPTETVLAYGLIIGVDANGYAAEVHFPDGAHDIADEEAHIYGSTP